MAHRSPIALVKETFGDKAKLVEAVEKLTTDDLWLPRTNKAKGLAHVSNAKLLRLHATLTEVKEKFGSREKLIDAVLEAENRSKDAGLRQRLSAWPVPRLYDAYRSATKRRGAASSAKQAKPAATAKAPAGSRAAAAKAPAKKAAAKKAAAPAKRASKAPAKKRGK